MSRRGRRIIFDDSSDEEENEGPDFFDVYFGNEEITDQLNGKLSFLRRFFEDVKETDGYIIGKEKYRIKEGSGEKVLYSVSLNQNCFYKSQHFERYFKEKPEECLKGVGLIFHWKMRLRDKEKVIVKIVDYTYKLKIKELKTTKVNKFVSIIGSIIKASDVSHMIIQLDYYCDKCLEKMETKLKDGLLFPPKKCSKNCKSPKFIPLKKSVICVDFQKIRIQETSNMNVEAGRVPRSIDVELTRDLVGYCLVGDHVEVCGFLRSMSVEESTGRGRKQRVDKRKYIYLEANNVVKAKDFALKKGKRDLDKFKMDPLPFIKFSEKEMLGIEEIKNSKNLFSLIVNSISPNIIGLEIIKAGLTLSLFGGVRKVEKDKLTIRGDPHVLIVGDPGLGKSQLLLSCSKISPRGIYVCSKASTAKGLTVVVARDDVTGDYTMEAGALVLSDQGTCCIDEFDKLSKDDYKALLEAMEQQSISIAKAGIVCTLPSRCSVIAAANPVGGFYDRAKTVSENIKILPAMLSRFDLVFVLQDIKNKEKNDILVDYVLKFHANPTQNMRSQKRDINKLHDIMEKEHKRKDDAKRVFDVGNEVVYEKLEKNLRITDLINFDPIDPRLLKKYIAYTKIHFHPVLTDDAKDILKNFYMNLRKAYQNSYSTPITTRQLESLVRLAQARARVVCEKIVTARHAYDVIEIMKESFYDMLITEKGTLDFRRTSYTVKDKGQSAFLKILEKEAVKKKSVFFKRTELRIIYSDSNIQDKRGFDFLIDRLNNQGFLLLKGSGKYKLTTVSF